jgi:hypothetical protein
MVGKPYELFDRIRTNLELPGWRVVRYIEAHRVVDDQISNPTWCQMLAGNATLLLARIGITSLLAESKGL